MCKYPKVYFFILAATCMTTRVLQPRSSSCELSLVLGLVSNINSCSWACSYFSNIGLGYRFRIFTRPRPILLVTNIISLFSSFFFFGLYYLQNWFKLIETFTRYCNGWIWNVIKIWNFSELNIEICNNLMTHWAYSES